MNWRRGLLRVWAVGMVLWLAGFGYLTGGGEIAHAALTGFPSTPLTSYPGGSDQCFKDHQGGRPGSNPFDCFDDMIPMRPSQHEAAIWLESLALVGLGPPLLTLLLGFVIAWALAGFKP